MNEETVMALVLLVAMVILLVLYFVSFYSQRKYYRKIVNNIFDGTYVLKEVKYSSTNYVKSSGWLMLLLVVILFVPHLYRPEEHFDFIGNATLCAIIIVLELIWLLTRGKREITLSNEGVTLKKCASINGADQAELNIAWDEIESVSSAKKQRAVITLTNGSKVEVKLNYIAPKRIFTNSWDCQEIVWQIEQRLRQRKA